jgi:phage recombination protein Bet
MSAVVQHKGYLVSKIAGKYSVDPTKLLETLKQTAFKADKPVSNEQMMSLLIVADQYGLNPFTREIFAFEDKRAGIVPVVSVDGWSRILNDHEQFDGVDFAFGPDDEKGLPTWCDCTIHRKDRGHPITVREYMAEVRRNTGPWQSHPRRMLRHKTLIQCARVALGFSGIYDEDEAARIAAGDTVLVDVAPQASRTEQAKQLLAAQAPAVNTETGEIAELPIADDNAQPPHEPT